MGVRMFGVSKAKSLDILGFWLPRYPVVGPQGLGALGNEPEMKPQMSKLHPTAAMLITSL